MIGLEGVSLNIKHAFSVEMGLERDCPKRARCFVLRLDECLLLRQKQTLLFHPLRSVVDPTRTLSLGRQ
jgi:hypothetical protein